MQTLSLKDVERLLATGSADARVATAVTVADLVDRPALTGSQRREVENIVRLFARDAEIVVRAALADQLKASVRLPLDVIETLARDIARVAEPILTTSELLTDDLLVEIVRAGDGDKQAAIAGRAKISEAVSDAIITNGNEIAVAKLAANEGAQIPPDGFDKMLQRFAESGAVAGGLANRRSLPATIAERLISRVSNRLSADLIAKHALPERIASQLVRHAREKATVGYSAATGVAEASRALARQMHQQGNLTPSIVVRAVCMGDLPFFEMAMSLNSGVSLTNAEQLIHDAGGRGLKALFEKSGIPVTYLPAARAAIQAIDETEYDGLPGDRIRFMRKVIERVLTQVEDVGAETLDYLMAKLSERDTAHA